MSRFWAAEVDGVPVAESVDAVALDPFPLEDGTPEDALALICQARKILAEHAVDLPVWTNEINYGVPSGGTLRRQALFGRPPGGGRGPHLPAARRYGDRPSLLAGLVQLPGAGGRDGCATG